MIGKVESLLIIYYALVLVKVLKVESDYLEHLPKAMYTPIKYMRVGSEKLKR